jgi:hypothetical protein
LWDVSIKGKKIKIKHPFFSSSSNDIKSIIKETHKFFFSYLFIKDRRNTFFSFSFIMNDLIVLHNVSTNVFFIHSLQKLTKESYSRKDEELHLACQKVLNILNQESTSTIPSSLPKENGTLSHLMILPFKLACHSRHVMMCSIALDGIEKLVAYGTKESNDTLSIEKLKESNKYSSEYDSSLELQISSKELVELVCDCFIDDHTDETILLHIIKTLFTIMNTYSHQIYGKVVHKLIRTIYRISVITKSIIHQQTTKVTLVQLFQLIFNRVQHLPSTFILSTYELQVYHHFQSNHQYRNDTTSSSLQAFYASFTSLQGTFFFLPY